MTRRVVITGLGTVNPLATDVKTYWQRLLKGESGIGPITLLDSTAFKVHFAGEVHGWAPEKFIDSKTAPPRRLDRFAQFALAAAIEAVKDSGIDFSKMDPFRAGCIIGSGIGGLTEYEEQHSKYLQGGGPRGISPFVIPKMMPNSAPGNISIHFGLCGPNTAVGTACASASNAIADALHSIQRGETDVMITGGSEAAIVHMGLGGFISARALSQRNDDPQGASRPFDAGRDGFVMGEAGAVLVLEELEHARARGARIHAELSGYGLSGDAHHLTEPDPSGIAPTAALRMALRDAGVAPEEVGYINAHATSTPIGDPNEIRVIRMTLGDELASRCLVSSTKSMHGHCLGAAGGVEAALTALALRDGRVPPTINLTDLDPACEGVDHVANTAREADIRVALSNGFGFGGHNAALVLRRWDG